MKPRNPIYRQFLGVCRPKIRSFKELVGRLRQWRLTENDCTNSNDSSADPFDASQPIIKIWSLDTAPSELVTLVHEFTGPGWIALIPLELREDPLVDHMRHGGKCASAVIATDLPDGSLLLVGPEDPLTFDR